MPNIVHLFVYRKCSHQKHLIFILGEKNQPTEKGLYKKNDRRACAKRPLCRFHRLIFAEYLLKIKNDAFLRRFEKKMMLLTRSIKKWSAQKTSRFVESFNLKYRWFICGVDRSILKAILPKKESLEFCCSISLNPLNWCFFPSIEHSSLIYLLNSKPTATFT